MTFHDTVLGIATSQDWLALGIQLILSTIIGGIIIVILLIIASKAWNEQVKLQNAFLMVFIINIINYFGVLAFLGGIPFASTLLPALIWIILTKLFFSSQKLWHAIVIGLIGFALSIYLLPEITSLFGGLL